METIEDLDWTEMWNNAIECSRWGQRAKMPEFWDEQVDWFEELVQQSDRAGMIMSRIEIEPDYKVLDIVAGRRNGKDGSSLWSLFNREKPGNRPDYIYLYNILYQLGIYANVEIMNSEYKQRFSDLDEAVEQWKENLHMSSTDAEEMIRSHLSETLIEEDGVLWSKRETRSAMIWWRKNLRHRNRGDKDA